MDSFYPKLFAGLCPVNGCSIGKLTTNTLPQPVPFLLCQRPIHLLRFLGDSVGILSTTGIGVFRHGSAKSSLSPFLWPNQIMPLLFRSFLPCPIVRSPFASFHIYCLPSTTSFLLHLAVLPNDSIGYSAHTSFLPDHR